MRDIVILSILFYVVFIATAFVVYLISPKYIIQEYPKEWEETENEEITNKFKQYKKSQEN